MIVFDIDDTISPTQPDDNWLEPHETARAFGFDVDIPSYILDVLRSRDDIALLSTWGKHAQDLAEAFGFTAEIWVIEPGTGIGGKYRRVMAEVDRVTGWADDHMSPQRRAVARKKGIAAIAPKGGYLTREELQQLVDSADGAS